MEIDDDRSGALAKLVLREDRFEPRKGIVERVHKQPAHQIDDEQGMPALDRMQPPAGAGRPRREIGRAQDAVIARDVLDQLALVPDMVAGRQDVGAGIVKLAREPFGQPIAMRGVLGVDDRHIDREVALQSGQVAAHRLPPGAPDDIAAKQDIHESEPQKSRNITQYIERHSGARRCREPGIHIPEACVHGFRAPSLSSGPGMTNVGTAGN